MRINVYHEEITDEFFFVETYVEKTKRTYYGLRFMLKSSENLHHTSDDDDRSAITFWFGTKERAKLYIQKIIQEIRKSDI
jgi:hypothetical protein